MTTQTNQHPTNHPEHSNYLATTQNTIATIQNTLATPYQPPRISYNTVLMS